MEDYEEEFINKYIVNCCVNNLIKNEIETRFLTIDLDKLSVDNLDNLQAAVHMFFIRINKMRAFKVNKLNEKIAY